MSRAENYYYRTIKSKLAASDSGQTELKLTWGVSVLSVLSDSVSHVSWWWVFCMTVCWNLREKAASQQGYNRKVETCCSCKMGKGKNNLAVVLLPFAMSIGHSP